MLRVAGGASSTATAYADEDRLVAAVREGDDAAFELIFRRYRERIGSYVRRLVGDHARAEDITQEVFLAALRRMRQTQGRILLKPWLYEIAKNASIDHFRRSRRAEEISYEGDGRLAPADYDRLVAPVPSPDDAIDTKHRLDTLCGAFGSLSDIHHEVLILRELEGRSYREIGDRLGLTRPAVESTLFRARRRLSEEYDELASGRRCARVQGTIMLAASSGDLGSRDLRRVAKHLSHCRPCRRHAAALGVSGEFLSTPRRGMARVAALIPWPALFLRRVALPRRNGGLLRGSAQAARVQEWSAGLSQAGDGMAAVWSKLVVSAVAVAAVGMGAGMPSGAVRRAHVRTIPPHTVQRGIVAPFQQMLGTMWKRGHLGAGIRARGFIERNGGLGRSRGFGLRSAPGDPRPRLGPGGGRPGAGHGRAHGSGGGQGSLRGLPNLYDSGPRGQGPLRQTVGQAVRTVRPALERAGIGRGTVSSSVVHAAAARRSVAAAGSAASRAGAPARPVAGPPPQAGAVGPNPPPTPTRG
ncbi:MAG TPA: sigma-70 family RNA polymerase sigma factor [Solirubrobacteraceae bacterium]|jgi:RNA polymerase sigma factor (sigma-70 family)|nr:sigma-70 family RNA polymerase sigma factor [Solirubrobacteraceae bacterium]